MLILLGPLVLCIFYNCGWGKHIGGSKQDAFLQAVEGGVADNQGKGLWRNVELLEFHELEAGS